MTPPSSPRAGRSTVSEIVPAAGEPRTEAGKRTARLLAGGINPQWEGLADFDNDPYRYAKHLIAKVEVEAAESRPSVTERPDPLRNALVELHRYGKTQPHGDDCNPDNCYVESILVAASPNVERVDSVDGVPAGPEAVPQSEPPTVCVGCGHSHPPGDHFTDDLDGLCRHCSRLPSEHLCAIPQSEREGLPNRDLLAEAIFESGVRQTMSQSEMAADNILAEMSILLARLASPAHPDEE